MIQSNVHILQLSLLFGLDLFSFSSELIARCDSNYLLSPPRLINYPLRLPRHTYLHCPGTISAIQFISTETNIGLGII